MDINSRIASLRKVMSERGIDVFIIPSSDNHGSEYVSEYFRVRAWISGFTGSAGTVVITKDEAHLWTDGRYFLQAADQLKGSEVILEKMGEPGVKTYTQWIFDNIQDGGTVSFNSKVFTVSSLERLKDEFSGKDINIMPVEDIFEGLWQGRPDMPKNEIFIFDEKYTGKSASDKISEVKEGINKIKADNFLLASIDDIAWLLNLRGEDVVGNPVFLSYFLMAGDNCTLYVDEAKITDEVKAYLTKANVEVKGYDDIVEDIKGVRGSLVYDPSKTNVWLKEAIADDVKIIEKRDITTDLKAKKNETELRCMENAHVKDGVAVVRFAKWLKENIGKIEITEMSAGDKVLEFRQMGEDFLYPSFDTIAGYGPHGAMNHYKAEPDTNLTLEPKGLFLLDSGGQYLDGTTDITRTFALGELTEQEREDYTLTLKCHLSLGNAIFREGTAGCHLDVLARKDIWSRGIDFNHGTGHGVGFFLNIHEGPMSIGKNYVQVPLEVGMVISNEPGVYRAGSHGIRIENLVAVQPKFSTEFGNFFCFKNLTLCPYDLDAIKVDMLTSEEIDLINAYHKEVFEKLSPSLNEEETAWLKEVTRAI